MENNTTVSDFKPVSFEIFKKTDEEKQLIKKLKKEHNESIKNSGSK
jgi:hypothetical protein